MNSKPPTTSQMRARMNNGHRAVLEAARDGKPLKAMRASDARGLMTCRATLLGWGAIDADGITEIGRALLEPRPFGPNGPLSTAPMTWPAYRA